MAGDRLKNFIENVKPETPDPITRDFFAVIEKEYRLSQTKDLKLLSYIISQLDSIREHKEHEHLERFAVELLNATVKYANIVAAHWLAANNLRFAPETDIEKHQAGLSAIDSRRRIVHNRIIDLLNILSRNYRKLGLDNQWRADPQLFDPSPESMRKRIGNWAVGIAAFLAKQERRPQ